MFGNELKIKIDRLERKLIIQNEEYLGVVRSHKDYNTLRTIREKYKNDKRRIGFPVLLNPF